MLPTKKSKELRGIRKITSFSLSRISSSQRIPQSTMYTGVVMKMIINSTALRRELLSSCENQISQCKNVWIQRTKATMKIVGTIWFLFDNCWNKRWSFWRQINTAAAAQNWEEEKHNLKQMNQTKKIS